MSIEDSLAPVIQKAIADYMAKQGKLDPTAQIAAIEQALVDLVAALEDVSKTDMGGVIDAIKGLKLTTPAVNVNVSPTPVQINLPDGDGFKPLTLRINRSPQTNLIDTVDVFEKA